MTFFFYRYTDILNWNLLHFYERCMNLNRFSKLKTLDVKMETQTEYSSEKYQYCQLNFENVLSQFSQKIVMHCEQLFQVNGFCDDWIKN